MAKKAVTLTTKGSYVVLDNGIVKLSILKPQGFLTGIKYGGMDNLLNLKSDESSRVYWDMNWSWPEGSDTYRLIKGAEYSVINMNRDNVEVPFRRTYSPSSPGTAPPLSFDTRYILRSGVSGFYCYAIYERPPGCITSDLIQMRMVFTLLREKFHYMAVSDEKQRIMPMPEDLLPGRGKLLIVPESVLLVSPINPDLKGEVDDKYLYSVDNKDGGVHGWISSGPIVGLWMVFLSQEFRNGGPTKQNLMSHTGPVCLAMCHGTHYIGEDIVAHFEEGETWRKVFGPFFIYVNSPLSASKAHNLWEDAKNQSMEETSWPYGFFSSPYYLTTQGRGSASGRLLVLDDFISSTLLPAKNAYVGLSAARTEGAWQPESKGYQFWVQTDSDGNFTIWNVVPGVYRLNGWVSGFIGDYLNKNPVTISAGSETELGNQVYIPTRDGPTVWEIEFPDRTAIDFYVPDVNPKYVDKLFLSSPKKFRRYGLWDRYTDIHPQSDQVFTVGVSETKKDWFFAHVDRRGPEKYLPTAWKVGFNLGLVVEGTYKLRVALASATRSDLQVHVNQTDLQHLVVHVLNLGTDNTVCRHGIHGLYRLFSANIPSSLLLKGAIPYFVSEARGGDALCGILYDYLRLEASATSTDP